jgi:hypothetical protein
VIKALQGVLADGGNWLLTVGRACRIAQIDNVLMGQLIDDRARDRKPAEPRIEDPDRSVSISRHERSAYK